MGDLANNTSRDYIVQSLQEANLVANMAAAFIRRKKNICHTSGISSKFKMGKKAATVLDRSSTDTCWVCIIDLCWAFHHPALAAQKCILNFPCFHSALQLQRNYQSSNLFGLFLGLILLFIECFWYGRYASVVVCGEELDLKGKAVCYGEAGAGEYGKGVGRLQSWKMIGLCFDWATTCHWVRHACWV